VPVERRPQLARRDARRGRPSVVRGPRVGRGELPRRAGARAAQAAEDVREPARVNKEVSRCLGSV